MADNTLTIDVEVDPGLVETVTGQVSPILQRLVIGIVQHAKLAMAQPKTGRAYRVGRNRIHIASAPGEAPAVDTGFLTNSINWQIVDPLNAQVTIAAEYAPYLEFGTRRMLRRPYVEPAINDSLRRNGILANVRVTR
jgi:hypothetical protein